MGGERSPFTLLYVSSSVSDSIGCLVQNKSSIRAITRSITRSLIAVVII